MSDLLMDIVLYLTKRAVVTGDGIDIFRDFEPDEPDHVVVLNEYGSAPTPLHESTTNRSVQVVVRDKSSTAAKDKAREIYTLLSPEDRFKQLTEDRWCQLYPRQVPFKMRVDTKGRVYYGFNLGVTTYID